MTKAEVLLSSDLLLLFVNSTSTCTVVVDVVLISSLHDAAIEWASAHSEGLASSQVSGPFRSSRGERTPRRQHYIGLPSRRLREQSGTDFPMPLNPEPSSSSQHIFVRLPGLLQTGLRLSGHRLVPLQLAVCPVVSPVSEPPSR